MNIEETSKLVEAITGAKDNDYELSELVTDTRIPSLIFSGEPKVGAHFLQAIMKRLYNTHSPIAVLLNPRDNKNVVCAPYARVNGDMMKEIEATFSSLCSHSHIEYESIPVQYLPLTWEVCSFKDGVEMDNAASFDDNPSIVLSSRITNSPVLSKIKMSASQAKKAALIDSILMYSREEIKGDKVKAKELIPLISSARSQDMACFLAMGRCLYRIFQGDGEGLDLWRESCVPEMQDTCDEYWPTLQTTCTYYTVHTLQYWASVDSPNEYKEWNSTSIRAALEASVLVTGGILDVANVAYRKNPTLFICDGDDAREAKFFYFNGTYYKECGTFKLQDYLDDEVIPEYEDFHKDLSRLADANPDNSFKEMMQKKIDKCTSIIKDLKKPGYQKNIIETLMRLYNRPGFDNIRDSNPNLTVFEDCVFDAELRTIRSGMPEDNATCSTGYEFREIFNTYTWEHPDVQCVLENMKKIIREDDKREVMWREFASRLHASNPLKRAVIVHGPTNNGKSQVYEFLSKSFGPTYCPDVPNNLLYAEDDSPGSATPQFEMLRFARLLPQMEVTDKQVMNEGLLKRFTGATDKITYRGLYQRKIKSFIPRCVPHTVCNSFPRINGNSAALRTRLMVLRLDAKFITEKDPEYEQIKDMTPEEQEAFMAENNWYWADPYFNKVIDRTYRAFMWILIQKYIDYSVKGMVPAAKLPECILRDSLTYFIKSNIYLQFIRQATKKEHGASGVTTFALYNAYKKWYTDNVSRFGYVQMSKFVEELEALSIKCHDDIYSSLVLTYQ